jgi:hypothetical protein
MGVCYIKQTMIAVIDVTKVIVELLHCRLKVWHYRTSLMKNFALSVTLHQLKQ